MQFERFVHGAKVRKTVPSDRSKVCQSRVQVRFVSSFDSMYRAFNFPWSC